VRGAYSPADLLAVNSNPGSNRTIPAGGVGLNDDPSFTGGYVELGYYLTGETRGYSGGRWARTKVLRPVGAGGWGAFQV
ncbi:porin, partial [Streptococcus pyogenes]